MTLNQMIADSNPPVPASDLETHETIVVYENGARYFQHNVNGVNVFRQDNESLNDAIHEHINNWIAILEHCSFTENTKAKIQNKVAALSMARM